MYKNDQKVHFKAKKAEKVHLLLHLDKPGFIKIISIPFYSLNPLVLLRAER